MSRVVWRLVQGLALLWILPMAVFVFSDLAPGSLLDEMRLDPRMSPQRLEALTVQYGLDQSIWVRYRRWVESLLRGEGGYSPVYRRPVVELMAPRLANTLGWTLPAALLSWLIALALGTWSALRQKGWADRSILLWVALLSAVPEVLLALGGLLVAVHSPLPLGGTVSLDHQQLTDLRRLADRASHLVIPVVVLVAATLPMLVRHVRSAVVEALDQPSVRAARGHGMAPVRWLGGYVWPAAANPLITLAGLSVGALVSGSMTVEWVLGLPGLGPMVIEAVSSRDLHVLTFGLLLACGFLVLGNALADLLLLWVDPRIDGASEGRNRAGLELL